MSNNFVDLELVSGSEYSLSTKDAQHQWERVDTEMVTGRCKAKCTLGIVIGYRNFLFITL